VRPAWDIAAVSEMDSEMERGHKRAMTSRPLSTG
jgi:hypothetical protein